MTAMIFTSGSPAAGLTRPSAARDRAVKRQPDRAEHREPRVPGMSFEIGGVSPVLGP
jgi:hypothetical protein